MTLSRFPLALRFLMGLLAVLALSLGAFYLSMHPPMGDLSLMILFLGFTTAISGLAGYLAYHLGWLERTPSLRISILGGYALASLLTFFNVWITARLMFADEHDLKLATILLVFATGIALMLGFFLSITITQRILSLKKAALDLAQGNLTARASSKGNDEVAALATSFNHMAERLQEADQQQRELDYLRRDLVAWASHDLQTPLTAIRVQIEAIADGVVDDPGTIQRYLRTTQRQVKELSSLIDDLFQMAQIDAGGLIIQASACSLSDIISDTLESFTVLAGERQIDLSGSVEPGIDPVVLDAPRIGRVFSNLVGNSIRHTPPGGSVTIHAERERESVVISVTDTGEGISAEDLPHVFERFYRGEKSRNRGTGGSGLGLAIAQGLVRAHRGEITVESQPGLGTTFRVRLPVL